MNKRKYILTTMLAMAACPLLAQRITTSNEVIDCGQVIYNQPVKATFHLRNKGNESLVIQDVETGCGCTQVDYPKQPVAGGKEFTLNATYDARQLGHFVKQFLVYSNGSKEPLMLTLRGVVVTEITNYNGGYAYQMGSLKADSASVEFDDVNNGDRPTAEIHILNTSSQSVRPVVMHIPNYLTAEVSPSTIATGRGGVVRFTLDSRKLRDFGLTQTTVYLGANPGEKVSEDKSIEVSAVLLPGFQSMTPEKMAKAPQLKLSHENLDLGSFAGKSKKKGEIEISNTGKSVLDIRALQMFTSGLQVSLNKMKIQPGETAKLKVTAESRILKGRSKSRPRVLMITNDPHRPKVVVHINVTE